MDNLRGRVRMIERAYAELLAPRGPKSAAEAHALMLLTMYGDVQAADTLASFTATGCTSIADKLGTVFAW